MSKLKNVNDLIRIGDAIAVLCRKTCNPGAFCPDAYCDEMWDAFEGVERFKAEPERKTECLTEDEIKAIRIHMNAFKERLCNQHRWKEAEEYQQIVDKLDAMLPQSEPHWIPCSKRLPSKEERKEWIDKNLDGIGHLYPCLVTRYSKINPDRTKKQSVCGKALF